MQGRGDQAVGALPRGGLLADGVGQELIGVDPERGGVGVRVRVQPALELRSVDLRVELDREVPPDAERLHGHVVARQHGRGRGRQAAVVVELQPGTGRDQRRDRASRPLPADLPAFHSLDPAAKRGAERLGAEADPEHGHARLVGARSQASSSAIQESGSLTELTAPSTTMWSAPTGAGSGPSSGNRWTESSAPRASNASAMKPAESMSWCRTTRTRFCPASRAAVAVPPSSSGA